LVIADSGIQGLAGRSIAEAAAAIQRACTPLRHRRGTMCTALHGP
jgi:hypothetical protein